MKSIPPPMLINGADVRAKWYHRLKRERQRCQDESDAFHTPVKDIVLRRRS